MKALVFPEKLTDIGRDGNAKRKRQDRNQIVESLSPLVVKQILAEQDDIACLCIGKDVTSRNIGIYILKSA